jgi:CRP-like cAMP-binding protein
VNLPDFDDQYSRIGRHKVDPHTVDILRRVPLFDTLTDEELWRLAGEAEVEDVSSDHIVLQNYETIDEVLYVVGRGSLRVYHTRLGEEHQHLLDLTQGFFFGKHEVLFGVCRDCVIEALEPTVLVRLEQTSFFRLASRQESEAPYEIVQDLIRPYLDAFLKLTDTFAMLDEQRELLNFFDMVEYSENSLVRSRDELCDDMLILYGGQAQTEDLEHGIDTLCVGDAIGARSLLLGGSWGKEVISVTNTTWIVVGLETFDALFVGSPSLVSHPEGSLRFAWQGEDEHVVLFGRSHYLFTLGLVVSYLTVISLVFGVLNLVRPMLKSSTFSLIISSVQGLIALIALLSLIAPLFAKHKTRYIVTTKRIVVEEWSTSGNQEPKMQASEFPLTQVEDVSAELNSAYLRIRSFLVSLRQFTEKPIHFCEEFLLFVARLTRRPERFRLLAYPLAFAIQGRAWVQSLVDPSHTHERFGRIDVGACAALLSRHFRQIAYKLASFSPLLSLIITLRNLQLGDVAFTRSQSADRDSPDVNSQLVFRQVDDAEDVAHLVREHVARAKYREGVRRRLYARRQLRKSLGLATEETAPIERRGDAVSLLRESVQWRQHWFVTVPKFASIVVAISLLLVMGIANVHGGFPFNLLGVRLSPWFFPVLGLVFIMSLIAEPVLRVIVLFACVYLGFAVVLQWSLFSVIDVPVYPWLVVITLGVLFFWGYPRAMKYAKSFLPERHIYALQRTDVSTNKGHVSLRDIENVQPFKWGIFEYLLDFGRVVIETASKKYYMYDVPKPQAVARSLQEALTRYKDKERQQELESRGEYIREWLAVYSAATEQEKAKIVSGKGVLEDDPTLRGRLRILVVAPQPVGRELLQHWNEWDLIVESLKLSSGLYITRLMPPTLERLEGALESGGYHVVHIIGHGEVHSETREQSILFEDSHGRPEAYDADALVRHFSRHQVRLVVLNVCKSKNLASEIVKRGKYVAAIGMSGDVPDDFGVTFAQVFYRSLAEGNKVDDSLERSRIALREKFSRKEAKMPSLYTPAGMAGILFMPVRRKEGVEINSGAPRHSNLEMFLQSMVGEYYTDGRLPKIAERIESRDRNILVLSGGDRESRAGIALAAAERNGWRFRRGVFCVPFWGKPSSLSKIPQVVSEVAGLTDFDHEGVWSWLQGTSYQATPVLLVIPEVVPSELIPESNLVKMLLNVTRSTGNMALVTCPALDKRSREIVGLSEIELS